MVCSICNGKGYVAGKGYEMVCSECQGRGECFFFDGDSRCQKQELQETRKAR